MIFVDLRVEQKRDLGEHREYRTVEIPQQLEAEHQHARGVQKPLHDRVVGEIPNDRFQQREEEWVPPLERRRTSGIPPKSGLISGWFSVSTL